MADITKSQQDILDASIERLKREEEERAAVPTQRIRTALQGLSIGTADEIEARARAITTGRPYVELLDEIRGGIKAYQEARPYESMAYEAGGALAPALFTGGGSAPLTLGRVAGRSALGGGLYAFNTGEGDFYNRATRVPSGAIAGGIGGMLGFKAGEYATKGLEALVDVARRTTGRKGASVVEREVQRLVERTGKSKEEIVRDLIDGKLVAENRTLAGAVKSLYNQSGPAAGIIKKALERRPQTARTAAMSEVEEYLGSPSVATASGKRESALRQQATSEEATEAAERAAYARIKGVNVNNDVFIALASALEGAPEAGATLLKRDRRLRGKNRNYSPLFQTGDDGVVKFSRRPTLEEAEIIRRELRDLAGREGREGAYTLASETKNLEQTLKAKLDDASTDLMDARTQAAAVRLNREAFEEGRRALSGDVNERIISLEDTYLQNPDALAAFKAGLLTALQRKMTSNQRLSLMRNLANEESAERAILSSILPDDQVQKIVRKASIAEDANIANQRILGNSITSEAQQAARDEGGVALGDVVSTAMGDPQALLRVTRSLVDRMGRGLTDAERAKVAQILVSDDPEFVARAISDERLIAQLQDRINKIIPMVSEGARRAGARTFSDDAGGFGGPILYDGMQGLGLIR